MPAAVVLVCFSFFFFVAVAPRDNLLLISDFFKSIFIEGLFEVVVIKGLGGAFYELKSSIFDRFSYQYQHNLR